MPEFTEETRVQLQKNLQLLCGHLKPRHSECVSHNHCPTVCDSLHEASENSLNFQTGKIKNSSHLYILIATDNGFIDRLLCTI